MPLPYLTRDFPGIGGSVKQRPEDFFVQEVPLYEPAGEGEHVYCEIQKVGLPTFDAVQRIAEALNVPRMDVGYAGLKDARAVARQVLSVRGTTEAAVMGLKWPDLTVLWAARHGNKLRLGHLAGNRFAIKVRGVNPTDVVKLKPVVDTLQRRGMPNYFGEQRFGRRNDNDRLGAALVRGDYDGLLKLLLGSPDPSVDDKPTVAARSAYDRNDLDNSMRLWPRRSGMERRVLARLIKTGRPGSAVFAVDERLRRLWVSALQSRLFNEVVARRLQADALDRLLDGDVAWKHDSGACFRIEPGRAPVEQPRCDAFEVSPSGPLLGYRTTMPNEGEALRVETEAMAAFGLSPADFRSKHVGKVKGARRPLRVKPKDVELAAGVDGFGAHVTVAFTLPAGSFATVLVRELTKSDAGDAVESSEEAGEAHPTATWPEGPEKP